MTPDSHAHAGHKYTLLIQSALVVAALVALAWRARPDGRLHIIFLATKGDAALIRTPAGNYALIDGGGDPAALAAGLGRHLPFWRRTLDVVVLTAADSARLPGQVAALERYRVALALAPPTTRRGATIDAWLRLLDAEGVPIRVAHAGDRLDLDGATLRVLATGDGDESGLVLRLDYGTTSVVFAHCGDEGDEEAIVASGPRPVTLLVFPWQRAPDTAIVAALRPHAMVLTDGTQADQPARLTFTQRSIGGAALYHEQLDGTIEWISDGTRSWIETEH
jgi:beta-lactamase superfamily II metal-dependent hydrolase